LRHELKAHTVLRKTRNHRLLPARLSVPTLIKNIAMAFYGRILPALIASTKHNRSHHAQHNQHER
jgi:hypothetical protein